MSAYYSSAFDRLLNSDLKSSRNVEYVETCEFCNSPSRYGIASPSPKRNRSSHRLSRSIYASPLRSPSRYNSSTERRLDEIERELRYQRRLIESLSPSPKKSPLYRSSGLSESTASVKRSPSTSITSSPMVRYHQKFTESVEQTLDHIDYVKEEIKEKLHDLKVSMISGRHKSYRLNPYDEEPVLLSAYRRTRTPRRTASPSRAYSPRLSSPGLSSPTRSNNGPLFLSTYMSSKKNDENVPKEFEQSLKRVHRVKEQIEDKMFKLKNSMIAGTFVCYRLENQLSSSKVHLESMESPELYNQETTQQIKNKEIDQEPEDNTQEPGTVKKEKRGLDREDLEKTQKKNYSKEEPANEDEVNKELFGENA